MSDYLWDKQGPPDPEVERLEGLLAGYRAPQRAPRPPRRRPIMVVAAASVVLAAAAAIAFFVTRPRPQPDPAAAGWQVASLAGAPTCGDRGPCTELRTGEWIDTGVDGRARLAVADIGHMDVEPGSRLRLVKTARDGHRLELRRGKVAAQVVAPPRLLIVDTPAVAAVDLGCAYTLTVDADGATRIHVTSGYVALESPSYTTIVVAGSLAVAQPGLPPSLPVRADASDALRTAALSLGKTALDVTATNLILHEAGKRDALTVWHMVPRVPAGEAREQVVARLEQLVPRPDGVTHEAALQLEPAALETWRKAMERQWWQFRP